MDLEHKVMEILEADDGKTFEEKKNEAYAYLLGKENTFLAELLLKSTEDDETGKRIKTQF